MMICTNLFFIVINKYCFIYKFRFFFLIPITDVYFATHYTCYSHEKEKFSPFHQQFKKKSVSANHVSLHLPVFSGFVSWLSLGSRDFPDKRTHLLQPGLSLWSVASYLRRWCCLVFPSFTKNRASSHSRIPAVRTDWLRFGIYNRLVFRPLFPSALLGLFRLLL